MTLPPISGKVGLDTKEFQAALSSMNRDIRVIESAFQATAAGLQDWSKSATGLEQRIEALNKEITVQTRKVEALQNAYEETAKAQGADSRAAEELLIKLNNETKSLNKMQVELNQTDKALKELKNASNDAGDEVKELDKKSQGAEKSLDSLKKVSKGLGAALKVGIAGVVALAGAVAGLALGIGKLVVDTANAADELVDLSTKTGISTERLQELQYISDQIGTDMDTITGSLSRLIRSMGSGSEAFGKLGVKIKDASGNLRDSEEVFNDVITALGKVENPTERDALAMEIFGKSAMELNPLIKAGADELNRLTKEAHKMGAVMSDESVQAAADLADQMAGLKAGLLGTLRTLASSFMPGFSAMLDQVGGYVQEFAKIVSGANGDLGKVTEGVGKLLGKIVTDIATQAPKLLRAGLSIVQSLIEAIITNLPAIMDAAISIIKSLMSFIIQNLPMLIDAGLQIIIALANGIAEALPELIPMVTEIIPKIIEILANNLPLLLDAALQIIIALTDGMLAAMPVMIEAAPKMISALVQALIKSLPILLKAAWALITYFGKAILKLYPMLWNIGKGILDGIKKGIEDNWKNIVTSILNFFLELIAQIRDLLDMHSPSGVFDAMGFNSGTGYVNGIKRALDRARNNLSKSFNLAVPAINVPQRQAGASGGVMTAAQAGLSGLNVTIIQNFPDQVRTPDQWKAEVAAIAGVKAEEGLKAAIEKIKAQRRSVYGV